MNCCAQCDALFKTMICKKKRSINKYQKLENLRVREKFWFFFDLKFFIFIQFWMKNFEIFRKFFDLKIFENFHSKMYEKWDRKKSKIFDLENFRPKFFRTLITSNFLSFQNFLTIFFKDLEVKSPCGLVFFIRKCSRCS